VQAFKAAGFSDGVDAYEFNSASIRVCVIAKRFVTWTAEKRHKRADEICATLDPDINARVVKMLLVAPEELRSGPQRSGSPPDRVEKYEEFVRGAPPVEVVAGASDVPEKPIVVKCVATYLGYGGDPKVSQCIVTCTQRQVTNGEHYAAAKDAVIDDAYRRLERGIVVFTDADDSGFPHCFAEMDWDEDESITSVDITKVGEAESRDARYQRIKETPVKYIGIPDAAAFFSGYTAPTMNHPLIYGLGNDKLVVTATGIHEEFFIGDFDAAVACYREALKRNKYGPLPDPK
jgi:hypothetical protein